MTEQLELNLAPQIRDAYNESVHLAVDAKERASLAVTKAIECGQLLLQQKQSLGHGSWLEWVDQNLQGISYETLARYMRVAKAASQQLTAPAADANSNLSPVTNLENAPTLKQAYIALGILPMPVEKSNKPDPNKGWVKYVRFIDGFRLWFNKRMEDDPLDTWPENARRILKNDLRWIAELYQRL